MLQNFKMKEWIAGTIAVTNKVLACGAEVKECVVQEIVTGKIRAMAVMV